MFCVFKSKEEGEEQTENMKSRKIAEFQQSISLEGCAGQDTYAENKQTPEPHQRDSSTTKNEQKTARK